MLIYKLGILLIITTVTFVNCGIYRLPKNVKPKRYFLTMEPFLSSETNLMEATKYDGSVTIELEILENTKNITFHQRDLVIDPNRIDLHNEDGKEITVFKTFDDNDKEAYTIECQEELPKDTTYNLTIGRFFGNLGDGEGFLRSSYTNNGTEKVIAATHFEPTSARRAFPCFDEPNLKATFIISLIRTAEYNCVSNEELDRTEDLSNGRYKDTFKETPLMSTYTLAFAVTDYKSSEKLERHRILARPAAIENGDWKYPLKIAVQALKELEEYTGIKFPIKKMDQIAIPDEDFLFLAMENWGLVVYGESHLLRNNDSTDAEDYKRTTCYIANEFAHQWFGNLVTASWWDHVWITGSFASYFQYYIADRLQPTWRIMDQYLIDLVHAAFYNEDHVLAAPLNFPIDGTVHFPPYHIMYHKGSAVVRMMQHVFTPDVFRRGLQIYLENNKYTCTTPLDIYKALQEAVDTAGKNYLITNLTVAEIFETWDSNKGYPLINVVRNYETGSITIEQISKFENETTWIVPINYVLSSSPELDFSKTTADLWLTQKCLTINEDKPTDDGWIIVNKQETGYYRVNYDLENWERLIKYLNSDKFVLIHPLNRAQLIDDAFHLAYTKNIPWEIPLRLCEYIVRERDIIPLFSFYNALSRNINLDTTDDVEVEQNNKEFKYFTNYTSNLIEFDEPPSEFDMYKQYLRTVLGPINATLGVDPKSNDSFIDQLHRLHRREFLFTVL